MFATGYVIEEDDLSVFLGHYLDAFGSIARGVLVGVHINDLPVTFVAEEESSV